MNTKMFRFLILIAVFGAFQGYLISSPSNSVYKEKGSLNTKTKEYVLYSNPRCPYCVKVLNYMEKNNITMPIKNVQIAENRSELIAIGGKSQVPCLVINGKALYESDEIIKYLKKHF